MSYREVREERRQAILDGIGMNNSYSEIADKLGIRRRVLIRDITAMRKVRDPGFLEAEKIAEARVAEEKNSRTKRYDNLFFDMTGTTLREKTFQNMVDFYRPELTRILNSGDQVAAIRELPSSVRRTLKKNNILAKQGEVRISKIACEQLEYT